MFTSSDLRKGLKIELDGDPYVITEFSFNKPGKGQAIYTCKLRNLLSGTTMTKQFRSSDKIDKPELEEKTLRYSYQDNDQFVFLDENYAQVYLGADILGDRRFFLEEDAPVEVLFYKGKAIEIDLPNFVEKEIIQTEPGERGNTATNVMKAATIEGGYEIQVPLFVEQGDVVKIDTRTGSYADRVLKGK